uniref:Gamma-aminobutyric acid receptor subunit beta n=1 Tax=Panagrellus redivivus TaxID=6233 RepID=A0A7E4ZZF2_PANRE
MIVVRICLIYITISITSAFDWKTMNRRLLSREPEPPLFSGKPLTVHVGMFFESMSNLKESQMSIDVDIYLYMSWKDQNLAHTDGTWTINTPEHKKKIWTPDVYFANAMSAKLHDVTVPNFNLYIKNDGTVAFSLRTTLTVACPLDLRNYPMDEQHCKIEALSYSFTEEMVRLRWFRTQPISINEEITLPEFVLQQTKATYCNGTYEYAVTAAGKNTGKFSCLLANLYLRRSIWHTVLSTYIPASGIVAVSWTSFYIDRRATPARVTLTFMTLLSLTSLGNGMRFSLPQVSYPKAIDFYFFACMLFVFGALIEFALVNSLMRKSEKYEKLANKYKDKKDSAHFMKSPIMSMEFQKSYETMMRMRRKSSVGVTLKEWRRKLNSAESSPNIGGSSSRVHFDPPVLTDSESEEMPRHRVEDEFIASYYDNVQPNNNANGHLKNSRHSNSSGSSNESKQLIGPKRVSINLPNNVNQNSRRQSVAPDSALVTEYTEFAHVLSRRALNIDKLSRVMFPVVFAIFNCVYWAYYLVSSKNKFE